MTPRHTNLLLYTTHAQHLLFHRPLAQVTVHAPHQLDAALKRLEAALQAGHWLAGWFGHELAPLLANGHDHCFRASAPATRQQRPRPVLPAMPPLLHVLICRPPVRLTSAQACMLLLRLASRHAANGRATARRGSRRQLDNRHPGRLPSGRWRAGWRATDHARGVQRIRQYLAAGDIYQANLTFPLFIDGVDNPPRLHALLAQRQPPAHGGYGRFGPWHLLSCSPELFLRLSDGRARSEPMKGTIARSSHPPTDRQQQQALLQDAKNRAENLMITDLMRNDLGRLAPIGGVRVPTLFTLRHLPRVHQMVSVVEADLPRHLPLQQLLQAVFPPGSVIGAPKLRAMEIIDEVEQWQRGPYTGCMGWLHRDAGGHLQGELNVLIRTLVLHDDGFGYMGTGSGIVADSVASEEYAECLLKARFLAMCPGHLAAGAPLPTGGKARRTPAPAGKPQPIHGRNRLCTASRTARGRKALPTATPMPRRGKRRPPDLRG